jgi:hypothetical protein
MLCGGQDSEGRFVKWQSEDPEKGKTEEGK